MNTKNLKVGVIGNPNCGKTTLFNALTGSNQTVGNWSGVTVEKKTGSFAIGNTKIELIDLPGTYSLDIGAGQSAIDEQIARDFLSSQQADIFLNIVDASRLERSLYLTCQLREMDVPLIVVLNMTDVAITQGINIDIEALQKQIGSPVVAISAKKQTGFEQLNQTIQQFYTYQKPTPLPRPHSEDLDKAILTLGKRYDIEHEQAIALLEGNFSHPLAEEWTEEIQPMIAQLEQKLGQDVATFAVMHRYETARNWFNRCVNISHKVNQSVTEHIDNIVLNRFLGIPIFFAVMYAMFLFAINVGGAFIDFFDILFGAVFVDGTWQVLTLLGTPEWLNTIISRGVGGGIQLVSTFIPIIAALYLFLSLIEDSGYMARAAFVMDRLMRAVGLPGKSFVPLIVGFGCNVPAVMASRTLETEKDRLLTIAMSPFMSCGARLSVYALFAAAFFADAGHNVVFLLYLLGVVIAVLTGLILKNTLFQPNLTPFVMELPTYHAPKLSSVLRKTWDKLSGFIKRAGKTIIIVVTLLSFLNSWGTDGSFGNEDSQASILSEISKTITPVFYPLGIAQDNWPATVGIFTGIFAKEAVVGTLDALYSQIAASQSDVQETSTFNLFDAAQQAVMTIPANLSELGDALFDPLGLSAVSASDKLAAAEAQDIRLSTFVAMGDLFNGSVGAFAYLVFVLLYTPCVAVIGAMYREAGAKWMAFVVLWSTGLAYVTATSIYQIATFNSNPIFATKWLIGCAVCSGLAIIAMKRHGKKIAEQNAMIIPIVNIS